MDSLRFRYLCIILCTFLHHGWLFLTANQYLYDTGPCSYYWRHGEPQLLFTWWIDAGLPLHALILSIMSFLPKYSEQIYALLVCLIQICNGIFLSIILDRMNFKPFFSLAATLLVISSPFFTAWPAPAFLGHLMIPLFFTIAVWAYLLWLDQSTSWHLRLIGSFFLVMSFTVKSYLVFGPFLFISLALTRWGLKRTLKNTFRIGLFVEWVLCPCLFWMAMNLWFPQQGMYLDYNRPSTSVRNLLSGYHQTFQAVFETIRLGWILVILIGLSVVIGMIHKKQSIKPMAFTLGLLLVDLFPYVCVSKPPSALGYGSRHFITAIPIIAIFIAFVLEGISNTPPKKLQERKFIVLCFTVISLSFWINMIRQSEWRLRKAQDLAFLDFARQNPNLASSSIFLIEERPNLPNIGDIDLRFYEYTPLLNEAWGNKQSWIVVDVAREYSKDMFASVEASALKSDGFFPGSFQLKNYQRRGAKVGIKLQLNPKARSLSALWTPLSELKKAVTVSADRKAGSG